MSDPDDNVLKLRLCAEPGKLLPVAFVLANIFGLYSIYMVLHILPNLKEPSHHTSKVECYIFNSITVLLLSCYARSCLTHPGSIPEKEVDPTWQYVPEEINPLAYQDANSLGMHETKRSGDRRHCKWCAKFKPDRTHHCRICRTCILKMDHHCPWIHNCVGFRNHKYFFLLLFYCLAACLFISLTMFKSVHKSVEISAPFITMFLLLFGETLAIFLAIVLAAFFYFHLYLTCRAMTTVEFCEKQLHKSTYEKSVYDSDSLIGNMKNVLGDYIIFWPLPFSPPSGDGLSFNESDAKKKLKADTAWMADIGRSMRRNVHDTATRPARSRRSRKASAAAGTGSAPSSPDQSDHASDEEEDSPEGSFETTGPRRSAPDPQQTPHAGGQAQALLEGP